MPKITLNYRKNYIKLITSKKIVALNLLLNIISFNSNISALPDNSSTKEIKSLEKPFSKSFKGDLYSVYEVAKTQDQILQAAIAQYNAILMTMPISVSEVLPQIDYSGEWSKTRTITGSSAVTGTSSFANASSGLQQTGFLGSGSFFNTSRTTITKAKENTLTLNQVLFDLENFIDIFQANNKIKQAVYNLESARQNLIVRIVQNYFTIKSEEQNLVLLIAEKKAVAQQLDQAKARYKVGVSAKTDVDTAQARYDSIVTQKISAENQIKNSKDQLSVITNQKTKKLADLKSEKLKIFSPLNTDKWVESSVKNNPALFATKFETKIQYQNVQKEFSGHFPTLNYSLEKDRNKSKQYIKYIPNPTFTTKTLSNTVDLQLSIFEGGGVYFGTKQAKYNYQASEHNYELSLRNTITNTKINYRAAVTKYKEIQSQKVAVASAESSYKSTQAGYEVGTRNIVNLLDSISELYRQKRILATNRYQYLVNLTLLKQSTGTLEDKDVMEINEFLEY